MNHSENKPTMNEERLRTLANWWRSFHGSKEFRYAATLCANQLDMELDGTLGPFYTTAVYQGGNIPDWIK